VKLFLLPEPQTLRRMEGYHPVGPRLLLHFAGDHPQGLDACATLAPEFEQIDLPATVCTAPPPDPRRAGSVVTVTCSNRTDGESYSLRIASRAIRLHGEGPPGIRHGLRTLWQLLYQRRKRLPCLVIRDRPALSLRGFLLDISRGRLPRPPRLNSLISKLSRLKLNHLQLYVEHVYDFVSHPGIPDSPSRLTADDILFLDPASRAQGVDLVPCLALLGHMGRILSLPAYRALAECPPAADWEQLSWRQRLRGATLCAPLPSARRLASDLLTEYARLHSSRFFNACCDEPYDLGRRRLPRRIRRPPREFLSYVRHLSRLTERLGKRLMIWGDFLQHHPQVVPQLPDNITVLDWGYEPDTDFHKCSLFLRRGLSTIVCPSLRGYGRVFHDVTGSAANIRGYAAVARNLRADGLLVTEWGDMGHFNMLASGYYGLALAAALSWNPSTSMDYFRKAFSLFFGRGRAELAAWYESCSDPTRSWPWPPAPAAGTPLRSSRSVPSAPCLPGPSRLATGPLMDDLDRRELELAAEARAISHLLEQRARLPAAQRKTLRRRLRQFQAEYRATWLAGCFPHRLGDIEKVLQKTRESL